MAAAHKKDDERKAHFTFIWTIENTSALLFSDRMKSPSFVIQSINKTKWTLYADVDHHKGLTSWIRREQDDVPESIEIEYELSILATDGTTLTKKTSKFPFHVICEKSLTLIEDYKEIFFQRKSEFLPDDTLTFRCRMWRTGTEISEADTCFARTRLRADFRCFVWAVREFSSLRLGQKRTRLVNPTSPGSPQLDLTLFLSEEDGENYVSIQIDRNDATRQYWYSCQISLLDSDGKVEHSEERTSLVGRHEQTIVTFFFERDKILNEEYSLLVNDVLSLRCEFLIEAETEWSRIENYRYLNTENLETDESEDLDGQDTCSVASCPFKKTLEDLYEDQSLTDVSIRAGATLLHAHKSVLSARSPVFRAMFTQDMKKKSSNIVDIPDIDADTLRRLLLYIYKNTVEELQWENAIDLFRAADKYQLLGLRKKCSFLLKSDLSKMNVCSILLISFMHGDGGLRKAAEDFILEHDDEVFDSDEWKNFKEENFRLALEITEKIIRLVKLRNQ